MNSKRICFISGLAAVAFALHPVQADVILGWEIQGEGATVVTTSYADTVISDVLTGSAYNGLTRTGLTGANAGNSYNSSGWNISNVHSQGNDYIGFQLAPDAGFELTLTTLQYVMNGSNTGPNNGRWGYSVGGGAFTLQDPFTITFALPGSLATWDFADIQTTDSVEFRFWAYGATSINGVVSQSGGTARVGNIAGNDLVLNGTVAVVPEPGSLAMMGLGALGLWAFARRRA